MSYRVKQRIFSGVVCEQEIFSVSSSRQKKTPKSYSMKIRFESDEAYERYKDGVRRRNFIRIVNANYDPESLYITLTFDKENEVHTFEEARMIRDLYYRRLKYMYPDSVPCLVMGRGKTTNRIHLHMISKGIPKEYIIQQWTYGSIVDVQTLREHNYYNNIDCGADYTALANYLYDHWTPEQGGHHYKISKNAKKPEKEKPTQPTREYSVDHPPRPPKGYTYTEGYQTEYGYMRFKYVKIPEHDKKQGSRGNLLNTPCIYERFCDDDGGTGARRAMTDPPPRRRSSLQQP